MRTHALLVLAGCLYLLNLGLPLPAAAIPPTSFERAKIELRRQVYHDRNRAEPGDLYCGCQWEWAGRSGGQIHLSSCGYQIRAQPHRAERLEWEHIVPARVLGHQRQCWQQGGRQHCRAHDAVFRAMEADLHNLAPTIGEMNADRSHFQYSMLGSTSYAYGRCSTRVSFSSRAVEPRNEVKGMVARVYLYMHDYYQLPMSKKQHQLFIAWHRQYPVSDWEIIRDRRIARVMGRHNPYVVPVQRETGSLPSIAIKTIVASSSRRHTSPHIARPSLSK